MADPGQAPPFADWRNDSPFRETFLRHLTEPRLAEAFRVVGGAVFEWLLEYERFLPGEAESVTRAGLRAAAADLRWVAGHLWHEVAGDGDDEDDHLAKQAPVWAMEVVRVAEGIEARIGPVPEGKREAEG